MKPYGLRFFGHSHNNDFPHGDSCPICYNATRYRSGEERYLIVPHKAFKKAARKTARQQVNKELRNTEVGTDE